MFYSQQSEDKILYEKYLNYRDGFFIELGAMNGIMFSNTLFFENTLNWNGVLIEPTNQFYDLIKNRPKCKNYNYAISEIEGDVAFLGNYALGGIIKTMTHQHRNGWKLDNEHKPFNVKSIPISKLLSNENIKKVDLFSIDVEGGEYNVLLTFDWAIPVFIILIEMCDDNEKNNMCRNLMTQKGFVFDMYIGNNEVWINNKNKII